MEQAYREMIRCSRVGWIEREKAVRRQTEMKELNATRDRLFPRSGFGGIHTSGVSCPGGIKMSVTKICL